MGALVFPSGLWFGARAGLSTTLAGPGVAAGSCTPHILFATVFARCCLPCDSLPPVSRVGPAIPTLTGVVCGVWAAGLRVGRVRVLAWLVPAGGLCRRSPGFSPHRPYFARLVSLFSFHTACLVVSYILVHESILMHRILCGHDNQIIERCFG